jgi:hypothetical protein
VTQLVDTDEAAGPPPSDGLTLVGETKSFLKDWQRLMLGSAEWDAEQVAALRQRSRELEARARAADVAGLAHHLQSCEHCFWNGEIDKSKLAHSLRNVSEVAWQWRQDLRTRSDVYTLEDEGHVSRDRLTIDPPTLLAPPSVEMFESSPPPPQEPATEWREPEPIESWAKPSLFGRWRGSKNEPVASPQALSGAAQRIKPRGPNAFPSLADAVYADTDADAPEASSHEAMPPRRPSSGAFPWLSATLGVLGVAGVGVLVSTIGGAPGDVGEVAAARAAAASSSASASLREAASMPPLSRAAIEGIVTAAHGYGGIESPELADLLDAEAAQLAEVGGACSPAELGCQLLHAPRAASPADDPHPRSAAYAPPSWLDGLEVPAVGAQDATRVREAFEFHTRNSVGREAFQELLFRCGAQRDLVHVTLERYGLPAELLALPMVASGCVADMESGDEGRGLWQLTPTAAKAYHLRVKARVVDERLDPAKGTEAAVRLLEDLYRKTGSWELALAAYRLGPLALLSRLHQAAGDGDSPSLDEAGVPTEVALYVAKVQAFALVLTNLAKFRFEPAPLQPAEVTAALEVPPGTRLGLVARAAASSTSKIRELNPDVLGDRVPDWPGEKFRVRVPKDAEPRAREALPELIASADHADECVPHAFDWGRQRFTSAMASRCEHASNR